MSCVWMLVFVGVMIAGWMIETARREKFEGAASAWARRQGLTVLELKNRPSGCGGVFWRYNPKRHYHFRVKLRTQSGAIREAWIICRQSLFGGNVTDDIFLEYID
ncbi:MAG TPA: hypothetical protein VGE07_31070 [Herpetosiphonaceae bacterium]